MISVAIEDQGDPEALAATLSTLVGAAAEGLVRDVGLASRDPAPAIRTVIDAFGGEIIVGDLRAAIVAARGPWILTLPAGAELDPGWWREALHFIERAERAGGRSVATFTTIVSETGLAARWREWRLQQNPARGGGGLLARKETFLADRFGRPTRLRSRLYRNA